jgi:hypothetical protein
MFSIEKLFAQLSTEQIGFFTYRFHDDIPSRPGVYAWFLPLNLQGEPQQLLSNARRIFSYDTRSKGPGKWETAEAGFRWDPLYVQIRRELELSPTKVQEDLLSKLKQGSDEVKDRFRSALAVGSIFTKPLYVGLAKDLQQRYMNHVLSKSRFSTRFSEYIRTLDLNTKIEDLLFVCIPLAPMQGEDEEIEWYDKNQINALEHMLKLLCQPAFGDL